MTDACIAIALEGGTDVSGRTLARALRQRVLAAAEHAPVELDFAGVECASDSFLDELVAVLVAQQGKNWFRQHVTIRNLKSHVRADLLEAVQARLEGKPNVSLYPQSLAY